MNKSRIENSVGTKDLFPQQFKNLAEWFLIARRITGMESTRSQFLLYLNLLSLKSDVAAPVSFTYVSEL